MSEEKVWVQFTLNGKKIVEKIDPSQMMVDFLHEKMGLTGTKVCCGMGICKACTIACQRKTVGSFERIQSCITPVIALRDCHVKTVEGLAENGKLSPLQEVFLKNFSFQCGYSSPGFLMGAFILLEQLKKNPIRKDQVEEAIQNAVGEHVCRCTGYVKYYAAIREVIFETPGLLQG